MSMSSDFAKLLESVSYTHMTWLEVFQDIAYVMKELGDNCVTDPTITVGTPAANVPLELLYAPDCDTCMRVRLIDTFTATGKHQKYVVTVPNFVDAYMFLTGIANMDLTRSPAIIGIDANNPDDFVFIQDVEYICESNKFILNPSEDAQRGHYPKRYDIGIDEDYDDEDEEDDNDYDS